MKMSFSSSVKSELCKLPVSRKCCALAESYGILLCCHTFSPMLIRIVTEHSDFALRLPRLFRRAFGTEFDGLPAGEPENGKYIFQITDREKIARVYAGFGLTAAEAVTLHLNRGALENECCDLSFLRGAFLSGGSVIDPGKRYHLELTTTHTATAAEMYSLLLDLDFAPKATERSGAAVLYFKQSDQIEDFLTALGAPVNAMQIMEAKVEKDLRNVVNRRCNCETANLTKVVDAAQEQLAAIRLLRQNGQWEKLPSKLRDAAMLREEDPEATLTEMAERLGVSKSAVNHRMRKLLALAEETETGR